MPQNHVSGEGVRIVDIRTDTITKPTQAMRNVMAIAEVGDSVFGEDPTVDKLERRCADLLGKEDAVYLPSGTMCNLIAIMVHCNKRGMEFIAGDKSHSYLYELGGAAVFAGVQCSQISNKPDGTFCLEELHRRIQPKPHLCSATTGLIIIENTHNMCGMVLPLEWIDDLAKIASKFKVPLHMDGARIMNAVVQSKVPAKRIARDMDSVFFCFSKGLGCPMGSVLCGTASFVNEARRLRKMLGGGVRQVGIIAAACLLALDEMIDRLQIDHDHAFRIAKAIDDMHSDIVRVDLSSVQTNMALITFDSKFVTAKEFLEKLAHVSQTDSVQVCVKGGFINDEEARFVLQWEVTDEDVSCAIEKVKMVIVRFIRILNEGAKRGLCHKLLPHH
ncbi:probable low-specificity L-threonine aldolase 2 [Photinus pyralis]|uniref:probable low-specificity L-threonine aldolase 2 n=1 Tax=Photinus pyralis TaxID=7054 RepID=UPI00126748A3|nr:probable low-specificity L-threonine aldolase 2 [Photinus pyralis]